MNPTMQGPPFQRLVLGLGVAGASRDALRATARLAAALELELDALFIEEETLLELGLLPFVREIRLDRMRVEGVDLARIERELHERAAWLRRTVEEAAIRARTSWRFSRLRGDPGGLIGKHVRAGDLLVLLEGSPPLFAGREGNALVQLPTLPSETSLLYVPRQIGHRTGPVAVALAGGPGDAAALALATQLANRAGEQLLMVESLGHATPGGGALRRSPRLLVLAPGIEPRDGAQLLRALAQRLRVPVLRLQGSLRA